MTATDRAYARACLKFVLTDVRRHAPDIDVKAAWVWRFRRGKYEFHFGKFYWFGSAEGADDARAAGWSAWLRSQNVEGYEECA